MAGNMVYSIQLQLRVDDSQLDATIAKLGTLKKAAKEINEKATAGYSKKKKLTDEEIIARSARKWKQRNLEERLNIGARWHLRQFGQWRFSQAGWQNGLGVFQKRVKTFQNSFFNNVSSFSGLRYNAVNLGKVFTSLTGVVGKAIPALGAFGQVAIGAAKIWMGVHAWRLASSGLPLLIGTKLLNSNDMAEAASNLMQMRMAEKGLGGNYQATLNRATQLAAEYGFSRVGMLNAMNMFTGLNVDGKKLTPEEASHLAEVVGKIAHVGGLSFERVNVNLQQLLGQAVPSIRDIRELVGQAPFIGKLAMNMMEERGVQGDYRDWLKNKSNLRSVLDEFNELVESHPVMKARGQIALAKENFWMRIADGLSPYWDKIAQANEKLYSWLGDKIVSWVSNIDVEKFGKKLESFVTELSVLTSSIGPLVAKLVEWINDLTGLSKEKFTEATLGPDGQVIYTGKKIKGAEGKKQEEDTKLAARKQIAAKYLPDMLPELTPKLDSLGVNISPDSLSAKLRDTALINRIALTNENFTYDKYEKQYRKWNQDSIGYANRWRDEWYLNNPGKMNPSTSGTLLEAGRYVPNREQMLANVMSYFAETHNREQFEKLFGGAADADAQQLSDLSKGSKSVFINFNKEIVDMDINIASVENIEELGRKLEPKIEEVVVRGLTIALNNATSVT